MATQVIRVVDWAPKDPEESLLYGHTYGEASVDDPIATSEWTVDAPLAKSEEEIIAPNMVRLRLDNGVVGTSPVIKNKVTLQSGNILVRRVKLRIALR